MITPELTDHLETQLDPVYDELADYAAFNPHFSDQGRDIWTLALCHQWAKAALPLAQAALHGSDLEVLNVACNPDIPTRSYHKLRRLYHNYLMLRTPENDTPIVVDGTWQQFRPRPQEANSSLPRIMISPANSIQAHLDRANVPPECWYVWRPDVYASDVFEISRTPARDKNYDRIFRI